MTEGSLDLFDISDIVLINLIFLKDLNPSMGFKTFKNTGSRFKTFKDTGILSNFSNLSNPTFDIFESFEKFFKPAGPADTEWILGEVWGIFRPGRR